MENPDRNQWLSFTGLIKCGHCGNEVHMKEVANYDQIKPYDINLTLSY